MYCVQLSCHNKRILVLLLLIILLLLRDTRYVLPGVCLTVTFYWGLAALAEVCALLSAILESKVCVKS